MQRNQTDVHQRKAEPWRVTLVDTGENSNTGGRLKRVSEYLDPDEPFCFTYGDGVADIDISREVSFHKKHGKLATICAVQPPGRYGALIRDGDTVLGFKEKPPGDGAWINGGFFVLQPGVIDYIQDDSTSWEGAALVQIANDGELEAWEHRGFWQPMDTLREKTYLEELWVDGKAPWKLWS